ncbi:MAG: metal-dependent hydrolase [Verrucomicrobia bacterium]|nr:metal-dependent hydrolase [Verrucomicrobiota bacterium]
MDSISQLALGASVSVLVLGRRTAVWRAALWGGVCGTLPDLDVLLDYGDPIRNMTFHRAESHSLFYLTLLSPLMAALARWAHGTLVPFGRWWLALWLALFTHPWLDWLTVYGTQLFLPFDGRPAGLGSLFIIDPLYTLPLVVGLLGAARASGVAGWRWNALGLAGSCLYAAWSVAAQATVRHLAARDLRAQGIEFERLLVTATPLNTVLWRVVAMTPDGRYVEGFRSLADGRGPMRFDGFDAGADLREALRGQWSVERMAWFARGFIALREENGDAFLADLRMGQEPTYVFTFQVARRDADGQWAAVPPVAANQPLRARRSLGWVWARMWNPEVPPVSAKTEPKRAPRAEEARGEKGRLPTDPENGGRA